MKRFGMEYRAWSAAAAVLLLVGSAQATLCKEATPSAESTPTPAWEALQIRLSTLFRGQRPDGSFVFEEGDTILAKYPLFATFSLSCYEHTRDKSFVSRARWAISRYYDLLLTEHDRDRDLLIECPSPVGPKALRVEDPGVNSLAALDMLALSRLCIDIGTTSEALFWRMQAKTIAGGIVHSCYDVDSRFFFPRDPRSGELLRYYRAVSALPLLFTEQLGTNIVQGSIAEYLMKDSYLFPENPADYLSERGVDPSVDPEALLKVLMMIDVLEKNGYDTQEYRKKLLAGIDTSSDSASPYRAVLRTILAAGEPLFYAGTSGALDLFSRLVYEKRALDDPALIAMERNAAAVRAFLSGRLVFGGTSATPVEESVRDLYMTVSTIRRQLAVTSPISPWKEEAIFGGDFRNVVSELLDETIIELRRAEDMLHAHEEAALGLDVNCRITSERIAPPRSILVKITILAHEKPLRIKRVDAFSENLKVELFSSQKGLVVLPGDSTLEFQYRTELSFPKEGALNVLPLSIRVDMGSGRRIIRHYTLGVFVDKPIYYEVSYPKGRLLGDALVPIEISIEKKSRNDVGLLAGFYSPSGLMTQEGVRISDHLPEEADTVTLSFHIIPPRPCRPGDFPFVIKLFANGREMGTVRDRLFKHYNWTFLGPLSGNLSRTRTIGSGRNIDLFEKIADGEQIVYWRELPPHSYGPEGSVLLDRAMGNGGIGYLYTIIGSSRAQECEVFLASNVTSTLIFNGQEILSAKGNDPLDPAQATARLREGLNEVLIEVAGRLAPWVYFKMGGEEELTPDEFNNNLWELVEGYSDFHRRSEERFAEDGESHRIVTLNYFDPNANSVAVIGSFNGWSPDHFGMKKVASGRWEISLNLPPGKYSYRFLVDNRRHVLDPSCPFQESDGYGGKNSVLYVE